MDKKVKTRQFKKSLLDENYNFEEEYFNKPLTTDDWDAIKKFLSKIFIGGNSDVQTLTKFLSSYPNLPKGKANIEKFRALVDEIAERYQKENNFFSTYKTVNDYITKGLYQVRPFVKKTFFFPSEENEDKVVNMLRTCKKSLNIAIFTLTNNKVFAAVEEVWNLGCDVKIITDDECCKQLGSDIFKLAAHGIPIKTDDNKMSHMHNKFAVIDNEVVMTGSFNWTTQAVTSNQENVVFIQDEELAQVYNAEFNKLWNTFTDAIDQEEAQRKADEEYSNRKGKY